MTDNIPGNISGLREAAADLSLERAGQAAERGELPEIVEEVPHDYSIEDWVTKNRDGLERNDGISPREAGQSLERYRAEQKAEAERVEKIMRGEDPDAPPADEPLGYNDLAARDQQAFDEQVAQGRTERDQRSAQDQVDAAIRASVETERQHLEYQQRVVAQVQSQVQAIDNAAAQLAQDLPRHFPEVRFGTQHAAADAAKLMQQDPQRAALLQQCVTYGQQLADAQRQVTGQAQREVQAAQQAAHKDWKGKQNDIVAAKVPELRVTEHGMPADPQGYHQLQQNVLGYLRSTGMNDQAIAQAVTSGTLDSAPAALTLINASRFWASQQKANWVKAQPKPPVLRPGNRNLPGRRDGGAEEAVSKFNRTGNVRDAGKALAAMRRAAR